MGEVDNIPKPDLHKLERVKQLFLDESEMNQLLFKVAIDKDGAIVACAGGLLKMEYAFPLAEEQSLFGWIINVYTVEQHRNNGLASKLVEEVCDWLKEKGANRARLWASSSGG
ncbi:GNAT family N-acetyltransferase [Halalkalibacter alkalisediminis]|nr:GNAT family N-acetyltransferase [Halalkalibacter alkalisediminis]